MHRHAHATPTAFARLEREPLRESRPTVRAVEPELPSRCSSRKPDGDRVVCGAPRYERLSSRAAGVVRDELHLGTPPMAAWTPVIAAARDTTTPFAAPLTRERLSDNPAVHVEAYYVHADSTSKFVYEAIVVTRQRPRCRCGEQCGPDTVLVKRGLDRVHPLNDTPNSTLEISGLSGKET